MSKIVILIPGVGTSENATKAFDKMAKVLDTPSVVLNWQTIVEKLADPIIEKHCDYGTVLAKWLRKKAYDFGYDGSAYGDFKVEVQKKLTAMYEDLSKDYDEIVFVTYSWGGIIAYDFLSTYKNISKVKYFATMGCPLPFAKLSYATLEGINWINLWEKSDVIGHQMFLDNVEDIKVNTGFLGLTPISHLSYLKSKKCAKIVKEKLNL